MPTNTFQETLDALSKEYAESLPDEIKQIETCWQSLRARWHANTSKQLQRLVHTMTGNAANFGFPAVSAAARPMDDLLLEIHQHGQPPKPTEIAVLEQMIAQIKQAAAVRDNAAAAQTSASAQTSAATHSDETSFYLIEEDENLSKYLELQLDQIEANWQALEWAWHAETLHQLCNQVHTILENAASFSLAPLSEAVQPADISLQALRQRNTQASDVELVNLRQHITEMKLALLVCESGTASAKAAKPRHMLIEGYASKPEESADAIPFYLLEDDKNKANYLTLQLQQIEGDWEALLWLWRNDTLGRICRQLNTLTGNAANLGFAAFLDTINPLENFLTKLNKRGTPPNSAELTRLNELIELVKKIGIRKDAVSADASAPEDQRQSANKLVYVVDDDEIMTRYLDLQLSDHDFEIRTFNKVAGLLETVKKHPPDVLIMDIVLAEGELAGPQIMYRIQKGRAKPLPVVFISARTDMRARLAAVRASGDAYFTKPLDIEAVVAKLNSITAAETLPAYRVLIVDNTGSYGEKYTKILRSAQMQAKLLINPIQFMDVLDKFQPALVLINSHLKGLSGVELAAVIRQQKKYSDLPIVLFAQQFDQTWQGAVKQGVGDDFLSASASPTELVATVTNRIKNAERREMWNQKPDDSDL
ncbi:MAG: response regulator [Gammaproteobacteria bacterium]|nr:response regulator [Gammaproteobacteria bacterium]